LDEEVTVLQPLEADATAHKRGSAHELVRFLRPPDLGAPRAHQTLKRLERWIRRRVLL
jgi:hypothetical protein